MRTAITVGVTHDGKDELIHGLTVPLEQQRQNARKIKGLRVHDKFAIIQYQERDGTAITHRLMTQKDFDEQESTRARQVKEHNDRQAKLKVEKTDQKTPAEIKQAEQIKKEVAAHSENIKEIAARQELTAQDAILIRNQRQKRGQKPATPPAPAVKGTLENPYVGDADPAPDFGKDGEYFGNQKSGKLFAKEAGKWLVVDESKPPQP